MAKGFITLENGEDFETRWTGYDRIIEIVIKELKDDAQGLPLAEWLATRIPQLGEHKGDAVFHNRRGEMIERIMDLREFSVNHRELFWVAVGRGAAKLLELGQLYSPLNPERIQELLAMHRKISDDLSAEY